MKLAIVHDYLTQRGGAERVVLAMLKAFPGAPVYTSLYNAETTFPEFRAVDVRPLALNRLPFLRAHHRLALPLLAAAFERLTIDADLTLCSSSGWAHGVRATGCKLVYCHNPARWLYQPDRYLASGNAAAGAALALLRPYLRRWDQRAAADACAYIANSTAVRDRIRSAYGIEAAIVPPPYSIDPDASRRALAGVAPGSFLCVGRLLAYKNVAALVDAFAALPEQRLLVVGTGPEAGRLRLRAGANVRFLGSVADDQLRWLYANCRALVAASYEDFGLTPLEAAAFGKPSAVLRWGGFLDTTVEGLSGVFFDRPTPAAIVASLQRLLTTRFDPAAIRAHAARFSEPIFIQRLQAAVAAEQRGLNLLELTNMQ